MSNFVFNIAKGRVAELFERVNNNDPTNSAIIVVPVDRGAATDGTLQDYDTLTAVLGDADLGEVTGGTWARKTLTDADLGALAVDDTNNRMPASVPSFTWTALTGSASTDLVFCYDSDTTGGTDANLIPLVCLAAAISPDGSDVTVNAGDVFRAS